MEVCRFGAMGLTVAIEDEPVVLEIACVLSDVPDVVRRGDGGGRGIDETREGVEVMSST